MHYLRKTFFETIMHNKLPVNINDLLLQRTIESEHIE